MCACRGPLEINFIHFAAPLLTPEMQLHPPLGELFKCSTWMDRLLRLSCVVSIPRMHNYATAGVPYLLHLRDILRAISLSKQQMQIDSAFVLTD